MSILAISCVLIAAVVFEEQDHGVKVKIPNGYMEVAVTNAGFRIGASHGEDTSPCETSIIVPNMTYPGFKIEENSIVSDIGTIHFDGSHFTMTDASSKYIVNGTVILMPDSVKVFLNNNMNIDKYFGSGGGLSDESTLSSNSASAYVHNMETITPHYWGSRKYSALGVIPEWIITNGPSYPVTWKATDDVIWTLNSTKADLYLMPAATMDEGMVQYWTLTGAPVVLPRYAFGYLACRYGWSNRSYIESILTTFRNESWPIDAWISDFGWFTTTNDYSLPPTGSPTYHDFGYNNITFPQPVEQLKEYHEKLHLRFGGIRKPRLGNSELIQFAKQKGWLNTEGTGVNQRNINFTIPEAREWYSQENMHYLDDGVDFWWDDDGEFQYFNFYNWNHGQTKMLQSYDSSKRYFSISRAFTPGLQRMAIAVWTGDQNSDWEALNQHPGYLLKWQLAGIGYVTCDTGGFRGSSDTELLVRWYQLSTFMSVMRVHSTDTVTPHFPFLYGPEAAVSFRASMNLRYKFVPMIYSLAHKQHDDKIPIFRALMAEFPDDDNVNDLTKQWLVGSHLMIAPILNQGGNSEVVLPQLPSGSGVWYQFNTTKVVSGSSVTFKNASWETIPMYARSGAVIPLAPLVLYTDLLPGGPLQVQVYGGADGSFRFVEDDGETFDYLKGVRKTTLFSWNDQSRTLSWKSEGSFEGPNMFTEVMLTLFEKDSMTHSDVVKMRSEGSLKA
eukprot:TRINITY_DN2599_c0_g2_i3.p1 TRINITY_DN2599_c0_g2~~TRINITY_DN2599_c0_g2_i3.p1  ORF type:complete len:726 (+),score=156.72 TRINITY_DN2599_c0_g2_i3:46-2223(+)